MIGLDAAGKTTVLYKLKLGEVLNTIPTIGFNVETVQYGRTSFTVWDVGGRGGARPLWRHYCQNSSAVILVVDSTDRERLDDTLEYANSVKSELHYLLTLPDLAGLPLLVLANKQDLPNAMSVKEVASRLELDKICDRQVYSQSCCAKSGDGLYEGLDWLDNAIHNKLTTKDQSAKSGDAIKQPVDRADQTNKFAFEYRQAPASKAESTAANSQNSNQTREQTTDILITRTEMESQVESQSRRSEVDLADD